MHLDKDLEAMIAVAHTYRPPGFWKNEPELWFAQLEARFALAGVYSDHKKFNFATVALGKHVVLVKDLMKRHPSMLKYETLKLWVIDAAKLNREADDDYTTRLETP